VTILICDDEPPLRELMRVALDSDFRFAEAEDAETALGLAQRLHPDVVLLDVMLPGGDGIELLRTIRADPELANTRVAVVSAWSSAEDRARAEEAGADAFVPKPFTPERLVEVVDGLLEHAR
jgi:DNA-binding response OmpR family regulator